MPDKLKISKLHTRAEFVPESMNVDERTVDVTWSTGAKVRRWFGYEELSMDKKSVRLDFFNNGAPLLNNHDNYSRVQDANIGKVVEGSVRLKDGIGTAKIQFDEDENAMAVFGKVKRGFLKFVSIGYGVNKYERQRGDMDKGEPDTYRAVDWEPLELSMVNIPADRGAMLRDEEKGYEPEIIELSTRSESGNGEGAQTKNTGNNRAMPETTTPAAQAVETPDVEQVRKEAAAAERKRVSDIRTAVRKAGLQDSFADSYIESGADINDVRSAVLDELEKNDPNKGATGASRVEFGADERDKKRSVMTDALILRANPTLKLDAKNVSAAREYRGMSLLDMAREILDGAGVNHRGMTRREIAQAALSPMVRGTHTISDFPILLSATYNRTLRAAYAEYPRTFTPFTRRATMPDFREMSRAQISTLVGDFDQVVEAAEYKAGTFAEAKETYKLAKYGKTVAITWESIINDDLSALSRVPSAFAAAAARKQSDLVYGIITGNPNMADGNALFSVAHGNLAGTAAAINATSLSLARAAMRKQTGLAGEPIDVAPSFLVVGPDKETEAQQLIQAVIMATKTSDTNVFRGSLEIIVDTRVTGNQWYLSATPANIDTIEYAFLDGEEELFTEDEWDFNTDSYKIKGRMVFATKAIDWRGLYKNAGA